VLQNSLAWSDRRNALLEGVRSVPYSPELHSLLKNIDGMVAELSRLEVDARRTKKMTYVESKLVEINGAIQTLEQWTIMGVFLK